MFECFFLSFPLPVFHAWSCNAIRGSCTHVSSQTFFSTSGMKNCLFLNNLDKMHDGTINTRLVCFLSCESATFSCSTFLRSLADYTISLHAHSEPSRLITNWLSIDAHFLRSAAGCHVLIARYWSSDSNVSPMTQGVKTGSCLNFPSYFLFFSPFFSLSRFPSWTNACWSRFTRTWFPTERLFLFGMPCAWLAAKVLEFILFLFRWLGTCLVLVLRFSEAKFTKYTTCCERNVFSDVPKTRLECSNVWCFCRSVSSCEKEKFHRTNSGLPQ